MNLFKKSIYVIVALCCVNLVSSQTLTQKQKEREAEKTKLYTSEEEDRIQMWFYEETQKIGMDEATYDEYRSIISSNVYDMRRLNDKDKGLTTDEIIDGFNKIVDKTNYEVLQILTDKQYKMHEDIFGRLSRSVIKRQKKQQ